MPTLCEKIYQMVEKNPKQRALGFKEGGKWSYYSYAQFWQKVQKVAAVLKSKGIVSGDRVAILSANCPNWAIVDQAAMLIGAVSVPLHTTLSAKFILHILRDSGAKFLFIGEAELYKRAEPVFREARDLNEVVLFDDFKTSREWQKIDDWLALKNEPIKDLPSDENSLASIVYTSGTTGEPKGVMLSHKNFVSNVEAALRNVEVRPSDIFLSFLPLSHVLERMAGYYTPLTCGATICYAQGISQLSDNMKEIHPTIIVSVPRIFEKVYEKIRATVENGSNFKKKMFYWALHKADKGLGHFIADKLVFKKIRQKLGGRIRFSISGGASLNEKVARFFNRIGISIVEGYGLTETAPVLSCNKLEKYKFGTVGMALDNVEIKLMPDKEIAARGPNIMQGYYNKDELTKEAITSDGWFLTGDLGFVDDEGFLTIIGRKKEMVTLTNGKTIAPEGVEGHITLSPHISQAMVVGLNRPYLTALIVPEWPLLEKYANNAKIHFADKNDLAKNKKIREFILAQVKEKTSELPDYEQIKDVSLLIREFSQEENELTPTLKLRRDTIRYNFKKELDELYSK